MLIVEIIFTWVAWKRGWHGWALLPLTIALGIGFLTGMALGLSGAAEESLNYLIICDIACMVGLIIMVAKPRNITSSQQ